MRARVATLFLPGLANGIQLVQTWFLAPSGSIPALDKARDKLWVITSMRPQNRLCAPVKPLRAAARCSLAPQVGAAPDERPLGGREWVAWRSQIRERSGGPRSVPPFRSLLNGSLQFRFVTASPTHHSQLSRRSPPPALHSKCSHALPVGASHLSCNCASSHTPASSRSQRPHHSVHPLRPT